MTAKGLAVAFGGRKLSEAGRTVCLSAFLPLGRLRKAFSEDL